MLHEEPLLHLHPSFHIKQDKCDATQPGQFQEQSFVVFVVGNEPKKKMSIVFDCLVQPSTFQIDKI